MKKVGIVGYGVLGRKIHKVFPEALIYDRYLDSKQDLSACEVAFLAVPTDWNGTALEESEIEEAVRTCAAEILVIRSATNPGFADRMTAKYQKRIVINPEYFGESTNHPFGDTNQPPFLILGGASEDIRPVIELYAEVYNANIRIRQTSALEAEVIKLSENRAILFKITQIQELYDACEATGVDFYTIRDAVYGDDPRFNLWWTFVYPDKRGANSKCLPKDVLAWEAWAARHGAYTDATASILRHNQQLISKASNSPLEL